MPVIVKYAVEFPDSKLRVSNDPLSADFLIDAEIRIEMQPLKAGGAFWVSLFDLPEPQARRVRDALGDQRGMPLPETLAGRQGQRDARAAVAAASGKRITIRLGYFDGPFETVMNGVVEDVRTVVRDDRLVTDVRGVEEAAFMLRFTEVAKAFTSPTSCAEAAKRILEETYGPVASFPRLVQAFGLSADVRELSLRGSVMDILDELALREGAQMLVCDRKVLLGKPIRWNEDRDPPDDFDEAVNLASLTPFSQAGSMAEAVGTERPRDPVRIEGFDFVVAGDPRLRPAQRVAARVEGYQRGRGDEIRILRVSHSLSMSAGYVCKGTATKVAAGGRYRSQQEEKSDSSAEAVARRIANRAARQSRRCPVVEVCSVKRCSPGNPAGDSRRVDLHYGQAFGEEETLPSVRVAVDEVEDRVFPNKPIVSAFAWNQCGLVTPVYPGMKAVVAHHLGLTDDGLVTGFTWSENPSLVPPASHEGDWWLCLPVKFDGQTPNAETPAVNDLTAKDGRRVIEVSGLRISVGGKATVGKRPTEGDDGVIVVEHASGSRIRINADGALEVSGKGNVTITAADDLKIECGGTLTLTAAKSVEITAPKIDLN